MLKWIKDIKDKVATLYEFLGSNPNALAQFAHAGWGGFLTLLLAIWLPFWTAVLIVVGFAATKEYLLEWKLESYSTRGNATLDFLFFCVGIAAATIATILR